MQYKTQIIKEKQKRNKRLYKQTKEYKTTIRGYSANVRVFEKQALPKTEETMILQLSSTIKTLARKINERGWI